MNCDRGKLRQPPDLVWFTCMNTFTFRKGILRVPSMSIAFGLREFGDWHMKENLLGQVLGVTF